MRRPNLLLEEELSGTVHREPQSGLEDELFDSNEILLSNLTALHVGTKILFCDMLLGAESDPAFDCDKGKRD